MKFIRNSDSRGSAEHSGFALVVTLTLMVLLSILAIGMLALSSVSLRNSGNASEQEEARANARLALMLAIGELQKQLGPDQRISITADQRTEPGGDGSETISAVGNRYWTGVFDSWPASSDSRPTPSFRAWLVSGDPNIYSQVAAPETALSGSDVVELVGSGTIGVASDRVVKVPTVKVESANGIGRMAWWVGDQGVKAALSTRSTEEQASVGYVGNRMQGAPRNAPELADSGLLKPFENLNPEDPRTEALISWKQAEFLASSVESPRPLFHDLAAHSSGLLTNLRDGGFRKDLSMKLETFTSPPDLTDPENVLYTVKSNLSGNDEVGINFMELWGYYHLYKQLKYGGGSAYSTGGSIPSDAPYLQTKITEQELNADPWDWFKHPITINYQTIYSFEAAPHPDEGGNNVIWLNFDPVVTLWNPLDVAVDVPRHLVNGALKWNYLYSFWMIPYDIGVSINGGSEIKCSILKSSNWKNDGNFLKLNAGVAETLTLKPGEVVKISQEGGTGFTNTRGQSVGSWEGFNGKKGFNYGGGFRVPLLTETSSTNNTTNIRVVVSPTDTISYRVIPRVRTESGNSAKFALTHVWLNLGGRGGSLHSCMSVDSRVGYSRVQVGEKRRYGQYWGPNPVDIKGDEHPEVFPILEGASATRTLPVSALMNEKAPFMVHAYFAKTEEENLSGSRIMARFNPRAYSLNYYDLSKRERDMLPFESKAIAMTSWLDAPLDESFTGQGYFGSSLGSELGSNFVTTHSVPRHPIVSLGALQHSFANGFNMPTRGTPSEVGRKPDYTNRLYPLEPQISHAIGNSLAPSVIPPDETTLNVPSYPAPLADHSYLANRELWDDWFFSGIAPQNTPAFDAEKDQESVARGFFDDDEALPVARYLPEETEESVDDLLGRFFSGGIPTEEAVNEVASLIRVDGMFNVNSTSVEAWKAVLGGLRDLAIVTRTEKGSESVKAPDGSTPIVNIAAPRDIVLADEASMDSDQWNGRRALSDDEIDSLAQGIVKEVRKRGPFLSLADFVNRRVGTDKDLAKSGAIQSALDSEDVSVNEKQNGSRVVSQGTASRFEFPEAEEGAMHYGASSLVKQGDILTPIAPILSARSDSFVIRSYGDVKSPDGKILAQAWCEAVLERGRDYVDPSEDATTLPGELTKDVNHSFGREFRIVSFRWLNPDEV